MVPDTPDTLARMPDSSTHPQGSAAGDGARSVVARAFALLDQLHALGGEAPLTTLALRTGLPNATTHRLLEQLIAVGAVQRRASNYALGPRLHELGDAWEPMPGLRDEARRLLRRLAAARPSAVLVSVRGESLFVLEQAEGTSEGPLVEPRRHARSLTAGVASSGRSVARHQPDSHHHCAAATVAAPLQSGMVAVALLLPEARDPGPYETPVARIAARVGRLG
jgi:IclR family transcriptional regulator, acetate operon repressor